MTGLEYWAAIAVSLVSGVGIGVVLNYINSIKQRTVDIAGLSNEIHRLRQDVHKLEATTVYKSDELRRRVIALERKTHGFDLDGQPTIILERDNDR